MDKIPLRVSFLVRPELAGEPEKDYGQVNLLSLLYRQIKAELFINSKKMNDLMKVYLKDPRNQIKQTSKARSSEQSNVKRGLAHPGMTVKNFTKGLRVIRPLQVKFKLLLELRDEVTVRATANYDQDKLFSVFSNKEAPDNHNFLRELWDNVYAVLGFSEASWKVAVTKYLDNPMNGYDERKNIKSSERSNLRRGLACPNMTIENFTKAIRVLDPAMISLEMSIQLDSGAWASTTAVMEGSSFAQSVFDEEDNNGYA